MSEDKENTCKCKDLKKEMTEKDLFSFLHTHIDDTCLADTILNAFDFLRNSKIEKGVLKKNVLLTASIAKIRIILKRWEDQLCAICGSETKIDGANACGSWYPGSENQPFEYCEGCGYKNVIYFDSDVMPDSWYLEEIKKILLDFKDSI